MKWSVGASRAAIISFTEMHADMHWGGIHWRIHCWEGIRWEGRVEDGSATGCWAWGAAPRSEGCTHISPAAEGVHRSPRSGDACAFCASFSYLGEEGSATMGLILLSGEVGQTGGTVLHLIAPRGRRMACCCALEEQRTAGSAVVGGGTDHPRHMALGEDDAAGARISWHQSFHRGPEVAGRCSHRWKGQPGLLKLSLQGHGKVEYQVTRRDS